MLRNYVKLLLQVDTRMFNRSFISTSPTKFKDKWDVISAEYKKMMSDIEFERSLKSDHEVRHEKELKQIEQLKKGNDVEVHFKETAQDLMDAATEEFIQFQPASRVTDDDKKNNVKSLNRKLDKHLVLLVSHKIGNDKFYLLPQGLRQDGESLRQTADRVLKKTCGANMKASIYGNAPCSVYKYKYPKNVQELNGSIGAKVFIYFARYSKGQLTTEELDYKWLDRRELKGALPENYRESVLQMLIDE